MFLVHEQRKWTVKKLKETSCDRLVKIHIKNYLSCNNPWHSILHTHRVQNVHKVLMYQKHLSCFFAITHHFSYKGSRADMTKAKLNLSLFSSSKLNCASPEEARWNIQRHVCVSVWDNNKHSLLTSFGMNRPGTEPPTFLQTDRRSIR